MKISLLCLVLGLTVCIGEAAASRADLNFADNDDPAEITAALRHLTSTEDPNYNVIETNQDEGAVIAPAPKGAKLKKRSGRIAYGKPAAEGQFPTVVWLGVGEYICTGTLITKKAVMTAAHCVRTDSGAFINVKDVEVGFGSEYYDYTDAYTVDLITTAKYDPDSNYGDIALLRLKKPIIAKYVPLASASTKPTPKVDVVGRGELPGGKDADVMMYTQVSRMTSAQCKSAHSDILGGPPPIGTMCFGLDKNPSTQSCGGDSGGPYFNIGKKVQVAIVSYGPDIDCGSKTDNLEMATSVAYWRSWIETTLTKYKMR